MRTSNKGIELIKRFESLHDGDLHLIGLQPKMCPAGLWTEGWGRLVLDQNGNPLSGIENKGKAYKFSKIKTETEAEAALKEDLVVRENMINSLKLQLSQGQFDALVSFAYNVGFSNLKNSTLLRHVRSNVYDNRIRGEFAKWNKARVNGVLKVLPGLTRRRAAEAEMYFEK